ncbi:FixH family protein [Aquabacter sp. CN5-332]|uniref:FixH family protein n=1 Tax=Aquabacter sp. CN5-332 TaxID=3156608 RepID=UPI0032B50D4D
MSQGTLSDRPPGEITGRFVLLCILGFFGIVIAVNVVMARYAVSTFGGVETASAYKAGLAFRGEELAAGQQAERQWQVEAQVRDFGAGERIIALTALDARGRPLMGLEATARLAHPTDARRDASVVLIDLGAGRYSATIEAAPGQWDLVVDLSQGGERLFRSRNRVQLH